MERLRKIARNLGSVAGIGLALLLVLGASTRALAATDPGCTALNGDDTTGECRVSGPVTVSGVINLGETLHILAGGTITVPAAPAFLTLNITTPSGDFVMDAGSLISGDVACPNNGPNITVALSGGDIDLQTGSTIRSRGCSGGFIKITTLPPGNANIDGLVESVGLSSGTGGNSQVPGGGPITITACNLTVSDTGVVSSRGLDSGADLVHLEGCVVVINGLVESTGSGHAVPHNPANSCSDAATFAPRRNPVTRPGKPQESTGCVEIWSGTTVLIDSTGTHKGEVNADVGFSGGTQGRGWIDILANGSIEIRDGTGNARNINPCGTLIPVTFAVHANGGLCQNTDDGGLILIQSSTGDVTASGDAIQADATRSGGKGGQIIVEALKNISFSGANVFARGDFDATGGFGSGGKIGPTTPTDLSHLPLGPAPIRAFTGFLKWVTGSGDARPTGSLVPIGQRGEINLRACLAAGGVTLGASFPVNGAVVPPYPTVTNDAVCGGAPTRPAYATPFPSADCVATCEFTPGGVKEGVKFNDLNKNGILDPGEPLLDGWEIHLFGTLANGNPAPEIIVTTGPPAFLPGSYVFTNLPNGTYTVCEILKPLWTQSAPLAVPPPVGETLADCTTHTHGGTVTPGPRGYTFTVTDTNQTFSGNDFGNFVTEVCPEDLARASKLTRVVDLSNAPHGVPVHGTVQAAYGAAAATGEVIGLFGQTIENVVLDANKNVTITQCTNARVTASNSNLPVWTISAGKALIIGPDAVGGTVGWLVQSSGHELKGLRASGASEVGIQVVGNNNKVSWNSSNNNAVGVSVSGDFNDLRGGTVAFNAGVGVHLTASANNNTLSGATIRNNGDDGIRVDGSLNTLSSDKVYSNGGDGVEINGAGNILKSVVSNTGNSGSATENGGAEFRLNTGVTNGGGNKADNTSIPSAAKCSTFPNAGTVCE